MDYDLKLGYELKILQVILVYVWMCNLEFVVIFNVFF